MLALDKSCCTIASPTHLTPTAEISIFEPSGHLRIVAHVIHSSERALASCRVGSGSGVIVIRRTLIKVNCVSTNFQNFCVFLLLANFLFDDDSDTMLKFARYG